MNEQEWNNCLDRLLDGDPEAFEVIYGMTENRVYGTVAMLVSNKQDVNDIVSEIYIQLWKTLPNYDRSRPFLFWMNGIVINQVNNWRRQIWRRFRLSKRSESLHEEVSPEMPDELLVKNERQDELLQFIHKLPFKLRSVVLYRYYYDYSYEEIAELLAIPVGTVKSRNLPILI